MIDRQQYTPGPASGAQIQKDGDKWTLILVQGTVPFAGKSLAGVNWTRVHLREVGAL